MKPYLVLLALIIGCSPTDPFVSFTDPSYADTDGGAPVMPVNEDAGAPQGDTGAGGASTVEDGGLVVVGTGGRVATGGRPGTGGGVVVSSGGAETEVDAGRPADACTLVTHTSGIGLTWQDCVPLGTYNEEQAMRACKAAGASECRATNCGVSNQIVCGYNENYVYGCWGFTGTLTGYAKERSDSCSGFSSSWG